MVNTEDNDEPKGDQFDVDGKYVPRIFLLGKEIIKMQPHGQGDKNAKRNICSSKIYMLFQNNVQLA